MLGAKKSALIVAKSTVEKRVEDIKRVDIDIFDSGETKVEAGEFTYSLITPGTPISLNFLDKNTGYIRFNINLNGESKVVLGCMLDGETEIRPSLVQDAESGNHYEFSFRLKNATGTHFITLKVGNCKVDRSGKAVESTLSKERIILSQENFLFKFHILLRSKNQMSVVNVPQDTYRDALLNVTKLWLLSGKYDRVRRPEWAGFFEDRLRRYPMTAEGAEQVQSDLLQEIRGKIKDVIITDCVATPNLLEKSWEVAVTSTDTVTQTSTLNMSKNQKAVTINIDEDNVSKSTIIEMD